MRPEDISPDEIGENRIRVFLEDDSLARIAHHPITLTIDYQRCLPEGVVLPIYVQVTCGTSTASFRRTQFRRIAPTSYTFTPRDGGKHIVIVREAYHNRWCGSCRFDVVGERLEPLA